MTGQISLRLPEELIRWLRVRAAVRGITRSQYVAELLKADEQGVRVTEDADEEGG